MDYGAFFRADDGSLLVTSDSQCYEFIAEVATAARSGNVNTYNVSTTQYPLVFVKCGINQSAGILAIEGSPGAWLVSVLATVICPIEVFVPIDNQSNTGHGMVVYNNAGTPVFDSSKNLLNVREISPITEGYSFNVRSAVDMVSYVSGPVKPAASSTQSWVTVGQHSFGTWVYFCYPIGYDPYGGEVLSCGYTWTTTYVTVEALVKTTTWSIERGVAQINPAGIGFAWLLHQNGYYKEILQYRTLQYNGAVTAGGFPVGYNIPQSFINSATAAAGGLTKDNTYPYTTSRANMGLINCATAIKADYE